MTCLGTRQLHVITSSFDWFTGFSLLFVIGYSDYLSFGSRTVWTLCLCLKTNLLAKPLIYENEFDLHENKPLGVTCFHMNVSTRRLVLTIVNTGEWL